MEMEAKGKSSMFDVDWQAEKVNESSYLKGMETRLQDTDNGAGAVTVLANWLCSLGCVSKYCRPV